MTGGETDRLPALTRRQARVVVALLGRWQEVGVLSAADADRLRQAYDAVSLDWRGVARISVVAAVVCFAIAAAALFRDGWLIRVFLNLFGSVEMGVLVATSLAAASFFALGARLHRRTPHRSFSSGGVLLLACLSTYGAQGALAAVLALRPGQAVHLSLVCAGLFAAVAVAGGSRLVWVMALLTVGSWLGGVTVYAGGAYWLGMSYPLRFVLLGVGLVAASAGMLRWHRVTALAPATLVVGLLYLFVALWMLSIFGNYGDLSSWGLRKEFELFHWSVLFAAAAGAAIWHGVRFDHPVTYGFGVTFLFINLYTRYFEHFWAPLHKAAFFAVLGGSLWLLALYAQRILRRGSRRPLGLEPDVAGT